MAKLAINPNTFGKKPTAQQKLIVVNDKAGNRGIQNQQGSTRILFDSILLNEVSPQQSFQFFKSPNRQGAIWETNVDSINGLLGPGESMVLEYMTFAVLVIEDASGEVVDITAVSQIAAVNTLESGFYAGTFEMDVSNSKVLKPAALQILKPEFNPTFGSSLNLEQYKFDTDLVVMPALPLIITVRVPVWSITPAVGHSYYLRCTLTGPGSLLNLKQTV